LYLANGLLEIGHGESVVAFRVTGSSRVSISSAPRVVVSPKTMENARLVKHLSPAIQIESKNFSDRHSERDACRDNSAGTGAGNVVEVIGKPVIRAVALVDKQAFDFGEYL
jgi:hypothetical protein